MTVPPSTNITRLAGEDEARACAEMMSTTEPWITLRRDHAQSFALIVDPTREVYVARSGGELAEERILRDVPNVFVCVSSFNTEARRLYLRLGYEPVGELKDYIVAGHSELLLRKTTGPVSK